MAATAGTVNAVDHLTALTKPTPVAFDNVNGNKFTNGGTLILEITSSVGGTVSVAFGRKVDGQTISPIVYTLTGAQTKIVGGWPVSDYGSDLIVTASVATITFIAYQV